MPEWLTIEWIVAALTSISTIIAAIIAVLKQLQVKKAENVNRVIIESIEETGAQDVKRKVYAKSITRGNAPVVKAVVEKVLGNLSN